jgi:hypothetical protein
MLDGTIRHIRVIRVPEVEVSALIELMGKEVQLTTDDHDSRGHNGNGDADYHNQQELDDEFPLGDGTADLDALVQCPHCGEAVEISIDPGGGTAQDYVEDCEVCCQPWQVSVRYHSDGHADVSVTAL